MTITAIFLDDGGVMNDNTVRAAEWRRLVGAFLAPQLGGSVDAWGAANYIAFERQWERFLAWQHHGLEHDARVDFFDQPEEQERWLGETCDHVGVARPPRDRCVQLARETEDYVIPRVRAAYPGAVDAIRELRARGYALHTASGGTSRQLDGYLTGMGVRELFSEPLYGPDLAGAPKLTALYYERILAASGLAPAETLFVDDGPEELRHATRLGARTVLVTTRGAAPEGPWTSIDSLAELPALLARG